ncbi:TetR/AcrR family transcriptional regulator [Streptomyces sp. NPDC019531]|uniref:TetR/AcrR family transcriptional regulator n=1 Tax=Streptomyces sp. NPDC019531 TaxID=3365062 RepID=UPI00384A979C
MHDLSPEAPNTASEPVDSRLSAERQKEILTVVVAELREAGYEALSLDKVAAGARCGKATLYRLWRDKQALVIAALERCGPFTFAAGAATTCDTGSIESDVRAFAEVLAAEARTNARLLAALGHVSLRDERLSSVMRDTLIWPAVLGLETIVVRAHVRCELPRSPSRSLLAHLVLALLLQRSLLAGSSLDAEPVEAFAGEVMLPALGHPG